MKYALTITLLPKFYGLVSEEQFDRTWLIVAKHLKSRAIKLSLVAEHTKALNIHYHGIITMPLVAGKDCRKQLVDSFRRHPYVGFVCIKQADNIQGWIEYMIKDLKTTKALLGRPPLLVDDFDLFSDYYRKIEESKDEETLTYMDLDGIAQMDLVDEQ